MEVYFDNSATTRCIPEVVEAMVKIYEEEYGNPSSLHMMGVRAENAMKEAQATIADTLKCNPKEIIFTSGGTESNNMAVIGTAMANKRSGMQIITSKIEHAAIIEPMKYLEEQGFTVTYLDVDEWGMVDLEALRQAMTKETILVSIMAVNNEIGTIEPFEEIASIVHEINPQCVFHVDAIQAYGKLRIHPGKMGIDLLSVSSHKFNGPKGVGFLYVRDRVKIKPLILGGGQQRGMRSGTDNVPGIVGMATAARIAYTNLEEKQAKLYELRNYLMEGLLNLGPKEEAWVSIHGVTCQDEKGHKPAPHVVSASFSKVRSEVLLHALEDRGIYVSAGSACSSNKPAPSRTLQAIGLSKAQLETTVRFSLATTNTKEEVDYALEVLGSLLPMLRRYTRS